MVRRFLTLWLVLVAAAYLAASAPARAESLPQTRVGGLASLAAESRPVEASQAAETHQLNGKTTGETALECLVAAESEMTTVLGSKADVAPFVGKPGFNTFTGEGIPAAELDRANAQWLNQAIQRGDNILLKTDPAAHAQFLNTLPGNPQSAYLNLELPMLQQYEGVNVTQGFGGAAAAGK